MADFKVSQTSTDSELSLTLAGVIDERSEFPVIDASKYKNIDFDLKLLEYINSIGIRDWVNWIEPLSKKCQISMRNCPKRLVQQFNLVNGFLPKGTHVFSLYVPYFCEKCNFEKSFLFRVGSEVKLEAGKVSLNVDIKKFKDCKVTDCELEIDGSEEKYFQFLKRL